MSLLTGLAASSKGMNAYNILCNRCKIAIMRTMKDDVRRDVPQFEAGDGLADMKQRYIERTMKVLCGPCKRRYEEMLNGK